MAKHTGKIISAGVAVALVGISAPGFMNGASRYGTPIPDLGAAYDSGKTCGTFLANNGMSAFVYGNGRVGVSDISYAFGTERCFDNVGGFAPAGDAFDMSLHTANSAIDIPGAVAYGAWNAMLAGAEDYSISLGIDAGKAEVRDALLRTRPDTIPADRRYDIIAPE